MWYVIVLFTMLCLYAVSLRIHTKLEQIAKEIEEMGNQELIEARDKTTQDYNDSPSFWKGQKLAYICKEIEKRNL